MDNLFLINPNASLLNIQDAINERLTHLKSITYCLLIANSELESKASYGAISAIDYLIHELSFLYEWAESKRFHY